MKRASTFSMLFPLALLAATACTTGDTLDVGDGDYTKSSAPGKADSSVEAIFVDMEFDGTLLTNSSFNAAGQIEDQLLYTIGHLNGERSVGRLDQLELTDIRTQNEGSQVRISYHARLPVAWGRKENVPTEYTFRLPEDISFSGQQDFTNKYNEDCVDFLAHDVDTGSMWYYYRPESNGCSIDDADVISTTAQVSISDINTTGKYPEYHRIWEDDVLEVVAVFGKYQDGATSNSDAGIAAYNRFSRSIANELNRFELGTEPSTVPFSPGVDMPEITYTAKMPGGKTAVVTALLVDNVRTAPASFNNRYEELSRTADLIAYNGHAGLGANIRALARKGDWQTGQYAIVFMNGCDTFAYVDSALADAHADVNPDDPNGTKYMDIVTNAMPAFFREVSDSTMALTRGLLRHDDPVTFEQMFVHIDDFQVVLVSGEQDNEYVPGGGGDGGGDVDDNWGGLVHESTVTKNEEHRFESPLVGEGKYMFELTGNSDADLYVRTGLAPTEQQFECRPFKSGSNETCVVELTSPAVIHFMVRGWNSSSDYEIVAEKL